MIWSHELQAAGIGLLFVIRLLRRPVCQWVQLLEEGCGHRIMGSFSVYI